MLSILTLILVLSSAAFYCEAATERFSYQDQGSWEGLCNSGNKEQSPINIVTKGVRQNASLTAIQFNSAWNAQSSGSIANVGETVKFTPTTIGQATFTTSFLGKYELLQFHMHWGANRQTGSEHRFNGQQAALEIHFVHAKTGGTGTERDYLAVLGVLADVEEGDGQLTGVWSQLNISAIQSNTSSPVNITGLILSSMLPSDRSYYYYMGSLTTPPCTEIVQWFVFKNKITVPSAFLSQLRMVEEPDGQDIEINHRDAQPLEGRVVMEGKTGGSQSFHKPAMIVIFISFLLVKLF